MIDEDRAVAHRGERSVLAVGDRSHVVVSADAHEHDLGVARRIGRRRGDATRVFAGPPLRDARGPVEHCDLVTRRSEVTGHRVAHDAETDEGDVIGHGGLHGSR